MYIRSKNLASLDFCALRACWFLLVWCQNKFQSFKGQDQANLTGNISLFVYIMENPLIIWIQTFFWHLLEKFVKMLKPLRKKGKTKSIWREIFHFFKFVYNLGDSLEFDTFFDIFLKIRQIGLIFRKIMVKQVNLTNYFQVCLYFTWFPWIWHIFWHLLKN